MEQWIKRLGSALCASLLTVTLNTGIFADATQNNPASDPLVPFVDDAPENDDTVADENEESEEGNDPAGLNDDEENDGPADLNDGEEGDGPADLNDGEVDDGPADLDDCEEGDGPADLDDGEKGDGPADLNDGEGGDGPANPNNEDVTPTAVSSGSSGDDGSDDENIDADTSIVLFAANSAPSVLPAGDSESGSGEEQGRSGDPSASEASITVNDTVFSPTENAGATGWKYEDGCLILVGNTSAPNISTVDSALTIKAAGLNHISSLSIDGNIELIGTGILLVDHIEMREGADFNLRSNSEIYGENGGGVAVFLMDDNGNYVLINKDAVAILDENYTIPAGVTLIVPDDSKIVMQALVVGTYYTTDSEEVQVCYSTVSTAAADAQVTAACGESLIGTVDYSHCTSPTLTISNGATLVIESTASLLMNGITKVGAYTLNPLLNVQGTLTLNGSVSGGTCDVSSSGDVSGPGTFSGTTIHVSGERTEEVTELNLAEGSALWLLGKNADIGNMTLSGSNSLIYDGDSTIGNLSVEGSTLTCYTTDAYTEEDQLHFGAVNGNGSVLLKTGVYVLDENCKLGSHTTFVSDGTAAIYDYYLDENGHANLTPKDTPRVMTRDEPDVSSSGAQFASVPVVVTVIGGSICLDGRIDSTFVDCLSDAVPDYGYQISQVDKISISYDALISIWEADPSHDYYRVNYKEKGLKPVIVLETVKDGKAGTIVLSPSNSTYQVPLAEVRMIRILEGVLSNDAAGGGVMSSTDTLYTGSGQLGKDAGSVSGGKPSSIFSGNGLSNSQPGDPGTGDPGTGNDPGATGSAEGSSEGAETDPAAGQFPHAVIPEAELWVEETEDPDDGCYVLCAVEGEKTLLEYGGEASVSMNYDLPTFFVGKPLYAVFRMADGTLKVFRADYDVSSGKLSFRTDCLGRFVIVGFEFDGLEFSDAFYKALELWISQSQLI